MKDKTTSKRKRNEGAKVTVSKKKNAGKSSRKKAASSPLPKTGTARSIAAAAAKVVVSPSAKAVSQPITPEDETNAKTKPKAVQKTPAAVAEPIRPEDDDRSGRLDPSNKKAFVQETQESDDEVPSDAGATDESDADIDMDHSSSAKSQMTDGNSSADEDEPDLTPKRKKTKSKRSVRKENLDRLQKDGLRKNVHAHARQAVFIAAPYEGEGRAPSQHLYWARDPPHNCAQRLIARTPSLMKEAATFEGGAEAYALDIADEVTFHCRKARNKHINQLRVLFFTNKFGFAIGKHVLESDSTDRRGEPLPMKVDEAFRETLPTTKEMANLLMSSKMHAHPVFYKHFVAALASGKLCTIKKAPDSAALSSFIGVNHEAHFRLELWLCLNKQGL